MAPLHGVISYILSVLGSSGILSDDYDLRALCGSSAATELQIKFALSFVLQHRFLARSIASSQMFSMSVFHGITIFTDLPHFTRKIGPVWHAVQSIRETVVHNFVGKERDKDASFIVGIWHPNPGC